jgi:hypothetical protein
MQRVVNHVNLESGIHTDPGIGFCKADIVVNDQELFHLMDPPRVLPGCGT